MRLVPIHSLAPDATLGRDVHVSPSGSGIPLLRRGVNLTPAYVKALRQHGITAVWVEDALSEGVEPVTVVSEETRHKAVLAVGVALADAKDALVNGRKLSESCVQDLSNVAEMIAREIHEMPDVAVHLADMMGADQYLLQHVIDVTALGTLIAGRAFRDHGWVDHAERRRFDGIDGRLPKIALGLLLHDIGKLTIDPKILNKPGPLDANEWDVMLKHPLVGVEMLGEHTSFLIKAVVRSHHERWDGTGYPDGISGSAIHQFARVASVADVYDAVTSERCYKAAAPPHVGVEIVETGAGTQFDPEVVGVFRRLVMPYPPGYDVQLADGRMGVVVGVDPDTPWEPTVRVRNPNGSIEEIARAAITSRDRRKAA